MTTKLKSRLLIGVAVVAALAAGGGAYAATQQRSSTGRKAFLDDVAKRLHVTPQQLSAAVRGAMLDQLERAVAAGRLTQAQANAIKQRLERGLPPFGLPHPGLFFHRLGLLGGPHTAPPATAARYLGLSEAQLFRRLAAGRSLAQIATARGKTVGGLEAAMTAAFKARLDKAVAAKLMSSAQEQALLRRFSARLSEIINRNGPPWPRFGWRAGAGHGRACGLGGAGALPPGAGAGAPGAGGAPWDPGPTVGGGATSTLPAKPLGPAA